MSTSTGQSTAVSAQGTKFFRETTEIGEINSIGGPNKTRETIDVTRLQDDDGYRRFIASLRDAGEISLSMNFDRDNYVTFNNDFESDENVEYSIVFPDPLGTTFTFIGMVTALPVTANVADKITCDATIKISGPVHLSSVTSQA